MNVSLTPASDWPMSQLGKPLIGCDNGDLRDLISSRKNIWDPEDLFTRHMSFRGR